MEKNMTQPFDCFDHEKNCTCNECEAVKQFISILQTKSKTTKPHLTQN